MLFSEMTMITGAAGTTGVMFSPWFPRQADFAAFTLEVTAINGTTGTLAMKAFHKDRGDTGDGSDVDVSTECSLTAKGRDTETWPVQTSSTIKGFKELVRFQFTLSASAGIGSVTFRVLDPIWFDNLKAW